MADSTPGQVTPETPVVADTTPAPEVQTDQLSTPETGSETKAEVAERVFKQSDVDSIVQKRLAQESRRLARVARAEAERDYYRQLAEKGAAPATQEKPTGKPVPENFKDLTEYSEALADWKAREVLKEYQHSQVQQSRVAQTEQFARSLQDKLAKGSEIYPDFEEVVLDESLQISPRMVEAIAESDVPVQLVYHLGQNPKEAERIANLSPAAQIRELVKLEQKFTAKPTPTQTPPPIKPNGATSTGKPDIWAKDTPWEQFVKERRKQVASR